MLNLLHNSDVGFAGLEVLEVTSDRFSLVPRPFPPPIFDHLHYANTEGEGLGDLVMCGYVK